MKYVLYLLAAVVVAAAIASLWPRSTPPFRTTSGATVPDAEARLLTVRLNGLDQQLLIRGRRRDAPILLYLNGGPGMAEGMLNRIHAAALEEDYLTVQWDQRGSGRSYALTNPPADLTIDRHLADLHALVSWLKARYGRDKLILVGHSWGSILGLAYAQRHPEDVALYVGVGQVTNMREGERLSFAFTRAEAQRRGDAKALAELDRIGPPPADFASTARQRVYVEKYGGAFHQPFDKLGTAMRAVLASEYTLMDLVRFFHGAQLSGEALWPEILDVNFFASAKRLSVPVAFIMGRHDQMTPAALTAAYFESLDAPAKRLVWIEDAAHNPHWERPDEFRRALREVEQELLGGTLR